MCGIESIDYSMYIRDHILPAGCLHKFVLWYYFSY